ncbi:LysR family transcriptional regulator [Aquimarina sp. D1M17]|uniref:LysR family transcriptional regulator n=1 Tax=Aquimarina acroporae TaxID=2937283 RepID=UPI0020BF3BA6|nr:LysR family transcriptional regulator [Aquimarina acroporae]MCK8523114.1 LysR family transcriptional regulator [Aquimarina acroporae]
MINLEWLRTFSAIYECNSITEASKKLNMTQPGVSKHLSALEHHIGKKLFDRTTRRVTPTEYGKFLYSQIDNPLQQLQKVEYYSGQRAKKRRSAISIGCTSDFFKHELMNKIYSFDMYIVTLFGTEKELIEALEQDKIQLVVGAKKHDIYNHRFTHIKNEELMLICSSSIKPPTSTSSEKGDIQPIEWLQKQTWFVYDNELADIKEFWQATFDEAPKIIPRYVLPSYTSIVEVLEKNSGFSVVPKQYCKTYLTTNLIKAPFKFIQPIERNLYYSYKPKNSSLKEIHQFIDEMKKHNINIP